ncbi:Membrane-bound hydrophilic protein OS=Streptomyces aurantiogriseus OX=66870 GN=GCM10010251_77560 PE=4 SV=1 [Streptomyces aurantiogriseus]
MPAGKAIALAAMPTAVLMGMGFTPTLANAEDQPSSKNLTIDEYKDCVAALEDEEDASASPSPSASESESADEDKTGSEDESTDDSGDGSSDSSDSSGSSGDKDTSGDSSSDSGSDGGAEPAPSASASASTPEKSASSSGGDTATASPSPSETDKNVLETIGDALTDLFDGKESDATASASPSPSASSPDGSASTGTGGDTSSDSGSGSGSSGSGKDDSAKDDSGTAKDTTDAVSDAVKDTAEKAEKAAEDTTEKAEEAAEDAADATASPSPSASASTDADDCPVATDDESGIDNKVPLADDPWYLNASSLLLKGADYQGIVEVKTANGTKKKVLKYVISEGTDIGDLHQTVNDKQAGVTYHVQAGEGTTSTIRNGDTIMYTESISGNLFGLIPVTFSPENPPPLNIPLIYFTKVKVVQAGQFGGDLHIPGMHVYNTK